MNSRENQMQDDVEHGRSSHGDSVDARAYREVFRVLKRDPGYTLPSGFAEKVAERLMSSQSRNTRDYFWFAAGLVLLILACVGTVIFIGFRFDFGFLNAMSDYKGLAFFGAAFVIFLHWLDKRLVRHGVVD